MIDELVYAKIYTNKRIPIREAPCKARTTRPETHTEIQKAKTTDKDLTLRDGDGLFLLVKTNGKKIWRFLYQVPNTSKRTIDLPWRLFCTFTG
jgi:hypothetical protein